MEKSFHDMVSQNGIDESEYQSQFASSGMMLRSLADEAHRRNTAYEEQKNATVSHLKNVDMNKNREMFRLERALASNDSKTAMQSQMNLTKMQKEIELEYQRAGMAQMMFSSGTSTTPANPDMAAFFGKTMNDWKMQLDAISGASQAAVTANVKTFNTQDPATSFNDAKQGLLPILMQQIPELQQPG